MQLGVQFRNGVKLAVDLGPSVNAQSVGAVIRLIGARAAAEIRKTTDRISRQTTARMARKGKKR